MHDKNIVLIGFMGTGKTSVGKKLAARLNREFVDIDEVIEKEFGMPPTEFFKTYGEKTFRQKEKEVIERYCQHSGKVLSLGGGAFLQEEVKKITLEKCFVIFLDISWEIWKERIPRLISTRPVLQGKTLEETEELFRFRQTIYNDHHLKIDTDRKSVDEVTEEIVQKIQL